MKRLVLVTSAVLVLAIIAAVTVAKTPEPTRNPFLWMIETTPPSFLYGTIHLPDDRVLALPEVVNMAFGMSDAVYTEIPMDPATTMKAATAFMMPDGKTLSSVLPKDLYTRTDAYLQERGLGLAMLDAFNPLAIGVQLVVLDYLTELSSGKQALDAVLYARAGEEGKRQGSIETIDEQIELFTGFTMDEQIEMLQTTIDYLEEAETSVTSQLVDAYYSGDGKKLMDLMWSYMDPSVGANQKFVEKGLVERNHRMAERIDKLLKEHDGQSHFIAVGTAHYFEDHGILALMKERGYKIKRLKGSDAKKLEKMMAGAN